MPPKPKKKKGIRGIVDIRIEIHTEAPEGGRGSVKQFVEEEAVVISEAMREFVRDFIDGREGSEVWNFVVESEIRTLPT